jgi:hypothetical protein
MVLGDTAIESGGAQTVGILLDPPGRRREALDLAERVEARVLELAVGQHEIDEAELAARFQAAHHLADQTFLRHDRDGQIFRIGAIIGPRLELDGFRVVGGDRHLLAQPGIDRHDLAALGDLRRALHGGDIDVEELRDMARRPAQPGGQVQQAHGGIDAERLHHGHDIVDATGHEEARAPDLLGERQAVDRLLGDIQHFLDDRLGRVLDQDRPRVEAEPPDPQPVEQQRVGDIQDRVEAQERAEAEDRSETEERTETQDRHGLPLGRYSEW